MSVSNPSKENFLFDFSFKNMDSQIDRDSDRTKGTMLKSCSFEKNSKTSMCPFSEARKNLTEIVNKVAYGSQTVVFTRKGKEIAVLISIEDFIFLNKIKGNIF